MVDNEIDSKSRIVYHKALPTDNINDISINPSLDRTTALDILDSVDTPAKKADIKVFGSSISKKNPLRLGNLYSFLYVDNEPIFTLGPQCNIGLNV